MATHPPIRFEKSIPAAWRPTLAAIGELMRSRRFLDAIGALEHLGEPAMKFRSIRMLHARAMIGFAKTVSEDARKEWQAKPPEQRAREAAAAKAIEDRGAERDRLRLTQALAIAHGGQGEASRAVLRRLLAGGVAVEGCSDPCLGIIRREKMIFRVFYRHPRSMSGMYRHWKNTYYDQAEIRKGDRLGPWSAPVAPRNLAGDPSRMDGGIAAVQDIVRIIFSL